MRHRKSTVFISLPASVVGAFTPNLEGNQFLVGPSGPIESFELHPRLQLCLHLLPLASIQYKLSTRSLRIQVCQWAIAYRRIELLWCKGDLDRFPDWS